MSIHHSPNSPTQNSNAGRGDPPRSISLIALGWEANEIPYMPPEMIAEILATDLHAPTLLHNPAFSDSGFAPAPVTEYVKPAQEWRLSMEMTDRLIARLLVQCAIDGYRQWELNNGRR